jgi:hypothetical protein
MSQAGENEIDEEDGFEELSYNIAAIRRLLTDAFTPEDLERFCYDRPLFHPLVNEFGRGSNLNDMVGEVITYCDSRFLWAELLAAVQEENPTQYARHEHALMIASPTPYAPGSGTLAARSKSLPDLLSELKEVVLRESPPEKRIQALEKVAALTSAASEMPPELMLMESIVQWFVAELPQLQGPVWNAIGAVEGRARQAGSHVYLDFQDRFGTFY